MTTGFLTEDSCWPTEPEAIDAHYSALQPHSFVDPSGNVYTLIAEKVSGVWTLKHLTPSGAIASTFNAPTAITGTCTLANDPETNWQIGFELGMQVSMVMIAVFAIKQIYRK